MGEYLEYLPINQRYYAYKKISNHYICAHASLFLSNLDSHVLNLCRIPTQFKKRLLKITVINTSEGFSMEL